MQRYTEKEDEDIWKYVRDYPDDDSFTGPDIAFFEVFKQKTGSTKSAFSLSLRFKTTLSMQLSWRPELDEPTRKRIAERFNLAYSGRDTRRLSRKLQADGTLAPRGRKPKGPDQQIADENDDVNADDLNLLFSPHRDDNEKEEEEEEVVANEEEAPATPEARGAREAPDAPATPEAPEYQENIADPEYSVEVIEQPPAENITATEDTSEDSIVEIPVEKTPEDHGLGILMNGLETVIGSIGDDRMKARFQAINARYQAEEVFSIVELKRVADGALRMFD